MADAAFENKIEELEHIAIFGFDGMMFDYFQWHFHSKKIYFCLLPTLKLSGTKRSGLKLHQNHLIFPLGRKISILNIENNKQQFLCGHTNTVSAIAVSNWWESTNRIYLNVILICVWFNSGQYVGSGQISESGCRSFVILWDWLSRQEINRYQLHRASFENQSNEAANNSFRIHFISVDFDSFHFRIKFNHYAFLQAVSILLV